MSLGGLGWWVEGRVGWSDVWREGKRVRRLLKSVFKGQGWLNSERRADSLTRLSFRK